VSDFDKSRQYGNNSSHLEEENQTY
jgi:hypothetical protein